MKAIKFPECNVDYAKDQKIYFTLPAFKDEDGVVVTCWKMSWIERLKVLFTGKVWKTQLTFNKPLQPMNMFVSKKDVIETI